MSNPRVGLILGAGGQDGVLLSRLLLSKGYDVHGLVRDTKKAAAAVPEGVTLHEGSLEDAVTLQEVLKEVRPDELYNLAAQASVVASWDDPVHTLHVDSVGVVQLLEAVRRLGLPVRMFQASSMVMYGKQQPPYVEESRFQPTSPYGVAKLGAHLLCDTYRERYGVFVSCGILFHHESTLRPPAYLVRKITSSVARILAGRQDDLHLGNLDAECDWSDARDIVDGMWHTLQADKADDFILASGKTRRVRDVAEIVFGYAGLDWTKYVMSDSKFVRGSDEDRTQLKVTVDKARNVLGWQTKRHFEDTLHEMLEHDCRELGVDLPPKET